MPPGEQVGSNSDQDEDSVSDQYMENADYRVKFQFTDWFVEPLLNFNGDSSSMTEVYRAVSYWTEIALELKSKNYPIAEGISNWQEFDRQTREKAQSLEDFLDLLITPLLNTNDKKFEVLRVLIAQGQPYLDFKKKMSDVDFSLKCNTIWENDAVAYRCNTCALTPCMSLCEACFDANGHVGHDYTRFFSREGGACDCGNQDVIRPQGNCPGHGDESKRPKYEMKDVCLAEHIVMKLLVRLFLDYRGWQERFLAINAEIQRIANSHVPPHRPRHFDFGSFVERDAAACNKVIDFLQECANYGGPMRLIVSQVLLNQELYQWLTEKTGEHFQKGDRIQMSLDWRTSHKFIEDRRSVLLPSTDSNIFPLVDTLAGTTCYSLLDELIFWINRQLFPQNLVNFGLGMLSEPGYRDAFAFRFFAWYPICGKVIRDLCKSQTTGRIDDKVSPACSRAVHVTVQMLSSASLCKELNERVGLVKTIFDVTRYLICEKLQDSQQSLEEADLFLYAFADFKSRERYPWKCMLMQSNAAISQHGYWFVMGDIQNVLTHTPLAVEAVLNDECFGGSYMDMMCQMQGMNSIWRVVTGNALEVDAGDEVQKAYTLEFETLAVTLFNIVAAIQHEQSTDAAIRFFDHVKVQLKRWFTHCSAEFSEEGIEQWSRIWRAQAYAVSFHIPLHRHISTALTHFTDIEGFYEHVLKEFLVDEVMVRLLLIHPLRIQVARSEINCGMWVRNGSQARMSALIYCQWNVSSAFQTPDVDLIRFCGAHINKEHFVKALSMAFNLTEKVHFTASRLHNDLPVVKKMFSGVGVSPPIEGSDMPGPVNENNPKSFEHFRHLIRNDPRIVEEVMMNPCGPIEEGSSFDEAERSDVIKLLCDQYNHLECQIELKNAVVRVPPVAGTRRMGNALNRIMREHEVIHNPLNPIPMDFGFDGDDEDDDDDDDIAGGLLEHFRGPFHEPRDERRPEQLAKRVFESERNERTPVLREVEWIDPMFWGMFKLVAEIVVVRVNSGASSEEHYRQEMVNCMAMGNVPYSRLRASISEKGSRGSELIDRHFETILNEIGTFVEPNEASGYLQQGTYRLKTSVWNSELCPVFFMMRSTSMKHAREVFAKMETRERNQAIGNGGNERTGRDDVKIEEQFWVPFRLIDFNEKRRHRGISEIYKILLTERFIMHCIAVLEMGQDSLAKFHDATVQLAVYLLTLGVKYAEQLEGDKDVKEYVQDIYHTPFSLRKEMEHSITYNTICSFMIKLVEEEARKKDSLVPLFRNILTGVYDQQKVSGGRMIYLARFISILCKLSPTCKDIIQEKLTVEEILLNNLAIKEEATKAADPGKAAAKEAAKRRMAAIMAQSAAKNAQTMAKLMIQEGMSAAEVEKVDPSQQNREKYECPICGETDMPNTVEHPFGMLAKLSTNFLCEEQLDANSAPLVNLMDADQLADSDGLRPRIETRRNYAEKRRMANAENPTPEVAKVRAPLVGTDLKTCGHTAHILCFNAYRSSLYEGRSRQAERRELGCPMCRYTVNIIVPISFDKPYSPIFIPSSPLLPKEIWQIMSTIVNKSKGQVFQEDSKNVKYQTLYSTREGGGLNELWIGRLNSTDWAERQTSLEKSTVSTMLVQLAVTMVERSSVLRSLGVPERRKNARNSLTAHIMAASVATSKDVDFEVTLSAITSLFVRLPQCPGSCTTEPPPSPPPGTSSPTDDAPFDYSAHFPPLVSEAPLPPPPPPPPAPAPSTSTPRPTSVKNALTSDELITLATILQKSNRKRPMEGESEVRTLVPLFVLEPKPTLVRMYAALIDNQSVPIEYKKEIAYQMIRYSTGWVSAYTTLCLLLRLGEVKMRAIAEKKQKIEGLRPDQQEVADAIANALTSNSSFFEFMLQRLASPETELTDAVFVQTLNTAVQNYLRFASELQFHCNLDTPDTSDYIHDPQVGLEETMDVLNLDTSCLHQTEQGSYWTKMYRHNLGWMSKLNRYFQPCISEPLTWTPRRILRPPHRFEDLFTRFFHRQCQTCCLTPTNAVVCLMCGELVCIDDCCRVTHHEAGDDKVINMSEMESHAERCSSASGIFISVTSSMILILRGRKVGLWGTIYLDNHKEEDRNLRRGKPLYMCESRLKLLEYDWAEQEWSRIYNWVSVLNTQSLITTIRDCHLAHPVA